VSDGFPPGIDNSPVLCGVNSWCSLIIIHFKINSNIIISGKNVKFSGTITKSNCTNLRRWLHGLKSSSSREWTVRIARRTDWCSRGGEGRWSGCYWKHFPGHGCYTFFGLVALVNFSAHAFLHPRSPTLKWKQPQSSSRNFE
jgi:hypothetical protein